MGVEQPVRLARLALIVVGLVLFGACGADAGGPGDAATVSSGTSAELDWSEGHWDAMPAPPEGVAPTAPMVWTGQELVVWGTPGAAFDPEQGTWRSLPAAPIADRRAMVAVWTGTEVIYWGGRAAQQRDDLFADGAAFDPVANVWRVIAPSPLAPRSAAIGDVLDGTMVVWGGITACCPTDSTIHNAEAARYDQATESWSQLRPVPAPWSGDGGRAVTFTVEGSLYVFRGQRLGRYDAAGDQWTELAPPEYPEARCAMTGGPAVLAEAWRSMIFTWSGGCRVEHGRAFDTASGQWRSVADAPAGSDPWGSPTEAGDGAVFLVGWHTGATTEEPRVHAYAVVDDRWTELPALPQDAVRRGASLVWTGSRLIAWGSWQTDAAATGAMYTPAIAKEADVEGEAEPERLEPLPPYEKAQPADTAGYEVSQATGLWRLSDVEADDQTITVTVAGGGCTYFSHMTVERVTASAIELVAWNDVWRPQENYGCTDDLRYGQYRVRLTEPLNGRRLDGQCVPGDATVAERQCPGDSFVTPTTRSE